MKQAMLAKDTLRTSVLRMVISGIGYFETNKGGAGYEASDEDVLAVIQKEVKQHRDSIEQFQNAGRSDLVDKETAELEILKKYLPEQMGESDIRILVKEVIGLTQASGMSDMGKIMGALMPRLKGKADGNLVGKIVKEELEGAGSNK